MKNKGIYLLKNALFFCISKGIAFLAPLLFVKFVTLEEYGEVEFAYSTGSVCAVFLMLGFGGAYPYFILKKQERHKEQYFFLYGYLIFFLSCLFACFFPIADKFPNRLISFICFRLFSLCSGCIALF